MRKIHIICLILTSSVLLGCASQKPMYYWGNYSTSLYAYKKAATDESYMEHMNELQRIIEQSKERDLRVPPGICVEYGYLLLKEGKKEKALQYFEQEEQTYPESRVFVERLKRQITKDQGE